MMKICILLQHLSKLPQTNAELFEFVSKTIHFYYSSELIWARAQKDTFILDTVIYKNYEYKGVYWTRV